MLVWFLLCLISSLSNASRSTRLYKITSQHQQGVGNKAKLSVPLNDFNDNVYVGQISLGTPPQKFNVIFSTRNNDFWVVDRSCTNQQCFGFPESGYTRKLYDETESTTYRPYNANFSVDSGSGPCSGKINIDAVTLAGYSYVDQTFGAASVIPDVFGYLPYDGVVGLGLGSPSTNSSIVPVLRNLLIQFPQPIFTIWLDRHMSLSAGTPGGQITFGDTDQINCDPTISYVPLTSAASWRFTVTQFQFDSYSRRKSDQAISDSAGAFIGVPTSILQAIVEVLHANFDETYQLYTVTCDTAQTASRMFFTLGDSVLFVEGQEYILDYGLDSGMCVLMIFDVSYASMSVNFVLGEPFMRAYCHVYLPSDKKIGFARAIHHEI